MPGTVSELFPQRHATSLGMTHNEPPPLHTTTSSLFYQGSSTPPAILVSSSHPLLLTSHPVLLFLILSSFFWSCCGISLLLLHPFSSSPSFPPLSLSSCWALNHPLTPSLLACKLPFPFLSKLLLRLPPSLSSSYSLSEQCCVISRFQAENWPWKTASCG